MLFTTQFRLQICIMAVDVKQGNTQFLNVLKEHSPEWTTIQQ